MSDSTRRVLVLTNMWPTPAAPNGGVFVREQVEALREAAPAIEFDVMHVEGARSRLAYLSAVPLLGRRLRERRYDLVHAHYGLTAAVAATQRRVPVVATFHGSDIHIGWQRMISRPAARRADARIFVSERLRTRAALPGHVIPCGVNVRTFRPMERSEARRELGWAAEGYVVLFPGSPGNRVKNHELFQATLAALPPALRRATRPFALTGVPRERVPLVLAAVNAVLITSHYEGASSVAKEALACARPVVAVEVGDVPEMVADVEGCAIAARGADALAARLADALAVGEAKGGPTRVRERGVDAGAVARRVLEVYAGAVGRSAGGE